MESSRDDIGRFFHPGNIALIGVSRQFGFGHGLPAFLAGCGLGHKVFPVNPHVDEIDGLRAYPSILDVPVDVDLACILVPSPLVPDVMRDCLRKGVRAVIVMSAGFGETGAEGAERQEAVARMAREAGVRMMGPNCIGVVNVPERFATCEILIDEMEPGDISIVAQSGVFGNILMDATQSQGIRICKVATIGNRADLDETDFLEYLAADPRTRVIVLYLEGIRRGREFLETARRASLRKPVLAYLGGQTEAGRQATRSHTGSLAGFGTLGKAAVRQAGIWIARDPAELLETARVFALSPPLKGDRVFVVTGSGSLGVMASDWLAQEGMSLAPLAPSGMEAIRQRSPAWMNVGNPLDVGPSGLFRAGLEMALEDPGADAVIAIPVIPWAVASPLLAEHANRVASMFADRARLEAAMADKPVVVAPQGHPAWKEACREIFGPRVPLVSSPQGAARALGALRRYWGWRARTEEM
ncbi:MAG: CoA-binding protein [bacterium]